MLPADMFMSQNEVANTIKFISNYILLSSCCANITIHHCSVVVHQVLREIAPLYESPQISYFMIQLSRAVENESFQFWVRRSLFLFQLQKFADLLGLSL